MGVLTTFYLVDPEDVDLEQVKGTAIEWIVFKEGLGGGEQQEFGLPTGYASTRCSIDKSWDDWVYVFDAINWGDAFEVLTDMSTKIENPWGVSLRVVKNADQDDVEYLRGWMETFDAEKTKATCRENDTEGYDVESLHESGQLDYVVDNIDSWAKWLVAQHKPGMQLLIVTR